MAKIEETLRALRDVDGVYGSFVIARSGALVASDLPAIFDAPLFDEVGPRLTRLYETFRSGGEELDGCVLRYAEHKLYLRAMAWGLIGILSAVAVNKPALRMAVNLVVRRIDPEVGPSLRPLLPPSMPPLPPLPPSFAKGLTPTPLPSASSPPDAAAVAAAHRASPSEPGAPSGRQVRMYRGRPVTDE